ncbi:Hsp20/alpha crystallin family protein [Shewanella rhizosphaerae]|uniref:Hsp20/alpha crystallin family protein n=1 Tax=Shewanella TaxID=22 RepID=UPI00118333EA|nr:MULTISPECIES: Hsp20/alpha crystallin family protein [Shewanella]QYJ90317.1 Hsp20/alpha crystallin family protein [Shewanella halotolerans]QYK13225.1 Hsp20/alpha crystallin family protein [Shewanella rhizosphaerae]TVP11152.1 heat-shock protein Hsp20 [Shewanella sp. KCT]
MRSFFPSIFHKDDPRTALHSRLDNVFDDFAKDWLTTWPNTRTELGVMPAIDVKECAEYVEIKAELPDMEEKDIDVDIRGNYLTISGEKRHEQEKDEKGYHLRERSFGSFQRQIPLGFNIDADQITAKYKKGVLAIHVPKPAELQQDAKKVKVDFHE